MADPRHYLPLDTAKPWDDKTQELECVTVMPETTNTKTYVFQVAGRGWFRYLPGQFITIEVPIDGRKVLRTYTLSSSPSRPLCITITVKALDDGYVSRWLYDNLKVGDRIKAHGPAGLFSFHNHPAQRYLFISAGSGITPLMSMTRWLYDDGRAPDITFLHCARRPSEIIFRSELERMSSRVPEIKLAWIVEEADRYAPWTGYLGRLNQLMFALICPDYLDREIFCCGPEPFMQSVRDILHAVGFDMERYHEESFAQPIEAEAERPVHDDVVPHEDSKAEVVFSRSGRSVRAAETDKILNIARTAGLHIPSACQFGVCGTCKVKKISGEVHMVHNGGISEEEIAQGYILTCCSNPIGRVEIDF